MLGPLGNCGGQGSKYLLMDKKLGSFRLYVETSDPKHYGFKWYYICLAKHLKKKSDRIPDDYSI